MTDPTFTPDTSIRLQKIEQALTNLWRMLQFAVNKEQFNRLNLVNQQNITQLSDRITEAEERLAELEAKYDDLL